MYGDAKVLNKVGLGAAGEDGRDQPDERDPETDVQSVAGLPELRKAGSHLGPELSEVSVDSIKSPIDLVESIIEAGHVNKYELAPRSARPRTLSPGST
jgi:hypothetical protein